MRRQRLGLLLAAGAIIMAGCLSGDPGGSSQDAWDCKEREVTLTITASTSATIPLYRLNERGDDGEWRYQEVVAMGFENPNGDGLEVPNPEIRLLECDTLILHIENINPMPHTFHLHGGLQDWTMDGVPYVSQLPIHEDETFTYRFEDLKAGTYWYHCHVDPAHHIDLGMYGAFIVEEREPPIPTAEEFVLMLDEWDNCHIHGGLDPRTEIVRENGNYPAGDAECAGRKFQDYYAGGGPVGPMDPNVQSFCNNPDIPQEAKDALGLCGHGQTPPNRTPREWWYMDHPPYTPEYNTFTINGKAFPDTVPIFFEEGEAYRFRLINVGELWHSMHMHGHKMLVAYKDGYELESKYWADTLSIGPGERYDVIVEADNPGFWMFHDHVGLQATNDHQDPGGIMTMIAYGGDFAAELEFDPTAMETALDVVDWTKAYHDEHGHMHNARANAPTGLPQGTMVMTRDAMGILTYAYA